MIEIRCLGQEEIEPGPLFEQEAILLWQTIAQIKDSLDKFSSISQLKSLSMDYP